MKRSIVKVLCLLRQESRLRAALVVSTAATHGIGEWQREITLLTPVFLPSKAELSKAQHITATTGRGSSPSPRPNRPTFRSLVKPLGSQLCLLNLELTLATSTAEGPQKLSPTARRSHSNGPGNVRWLGPSSSSLVSPLFRPDKGKIGRWGWR